MINFYLFIVTVITVELPQTNFAPAAIDSHSGHLMELESKIPSLDLPVDDKINSK